MVEIRRDVDPTGLRVGVAVSDFNAFVTDGLLEGALGALQGAQVTLVRVPGSFELPVAARALIERGCEAVVALGAVIEGETDHYRFVASESAAGLRQVMVETGVPIGFGVLTVREAAQARERSAPGPGNKGAEAAESAVATARALAALREQGAATRG